MEACPEAVPGKTLPLRTFISDVLQRGTSAKLFAELRPLITLQIMAKNLEVICYYVGGQCKEEWFFYMAVLVCITEKAREGFHMSLWLPSQVICLAVSSVRGNEVVLQ